MQDHLCSILAYQVMGHTNKSCHSSNIELLVYTLQLLIPGHTGADRKHAFATACKAVEVRRGLDAAACLSVPDILSANLYTPRMSRLSTQP